VWGGIALSGMGKASDHLLVEAKRLADAKGLVMHMHQSFAEEDVAAYRSKTGASAVDHLRGLGILGPTLTLVHMIHTDAAEVDLLARSQTNVVHCPGASTRSGMGVSRVGHFPEMVEHGITVGLGSDSGNYSDFLDVGRQAYLAATIHREARRSNPVISAEQAFEMATINGAKALGLDAKVGSIEIGKQADLIVHTRRRPEWHPCLDVINTLVYSAQSTGVDLVVVGGQIVLENGRSTRINEEEVLGAVDKAARALYSRMGWSSFSRWPVV
jgi:5-methylthioadenosine/S-adenosylhomocysteine deaminase